jgi:hypothetical protein
MPFSLPRNRSQQAAYNRQLQERFASTCRVPPAVPTTTPPNPIEALKELAALRQSGALTDTEFQAAKSKLLAP